MAHLSAILIRFIAAASLAGVFLRPKGWPEAVWAGAGALLLVVSGLLPFSQALLAIAKGADVYLFLTGMMLLAELARRNGVFDWLATLAVTAAKGSAARLFTLIYLVGIAVTVFLSNDATAVVLTPAVYAAVQKARAQPLPYLFICAFIANAASFVLPISNPANLVVYGKHLPPLLTWLGTFFIPSAFAIGATYLALRWHSRGALSNPIEQVVDPAQLSPEGRRAAWGILVTAAILIFVSAFGLDLGWPTCLSAAIAVLAAARANPRALADIAEGVSWSVLPLVAGLFVIVEALNRAGARAILASALTRCAALPHAAGALAASFSVALLSNLTNNLPSGLLAGGALQTIPTPPHIRNAILLGIDLGPNLSVSGSLATVLWLIALRREGEHVGAWQFLKAGLLIMPPALLLSTLALALRP